MMCCMRDLEHARRSMGLRGYDYGHAGAYFVTICTQGRACLFGDVVDGVMHLNEAGRMVRRWWVELGHKFPLVEMDEQVTMPNHFHGIVVILGSDVQGAHRWAPTWR